MVKSLHSVEKDSEGNFSMIETSHRTDLFACNT